MLRIFSTTTCKLYVEILEFDAEYGEGDKLHRPSYVHKSTMQKLSAGAIFVCKSQFKLSASSG